VLQLTELKSDSLKAWIVSSNMLPQEELLKTPIWVPLLQALCCLKHPIQQLKKAHKTYFASGAMSIPTYNLLATF
jgi:hypothetical protein